MPGSYVSAVSVVIISAIADGQSGITGLCCLEFALKYCSTTVGSRSINALLSTSRAISLLDLVIVSIHSLPPAHKQEMTNQTSGSCSSIGLQSPRPE